ncbi:uncharacterized protein CC84DRAFT_605890 [Paraphaeosphaeria sporulosa]|uniref:Uncharacterized protein n=1 Tax=Paraphaeosphaeria sporulosa TaxID=1460663 RepID=A0A177CQB7_9PLEO|nr:uncharacterized protein CC84DRAFT_605890 [Paraphaeosphaeria sporulosa]OAG09090.1 hypothetical protein CC84DRAFT_605890 [Paraphaeosphaeria sporulosa]
MRCQRSDVRMLLLTRRFQPSSVQCSFQQHANQLSFDSRRINRRCRRTFVAITTMFRIFCFLLCCNPDSFNRHTRLLGKRADGDVSGTLA